VELPVFSGDNPRAWMLECDDVFNLVSIPAEQRVKWGLAHIRGQAKTWLNGANIQLQTITWDKLCEILIDRFPDTVSTDPMDLLQQLHQQTTVNVYIDAFEDWMTAMKRGRSYLPQDFFVDRFISGLKETIKHNVLCQKPETLLSAYWYARQYEKSYLSSIKRTQAPVTGQRNANQPPLRQAANRDNRPRLPDNRQREPRKCWYCPENWVIGHRCQTMQRALNTIQMQGHSDDEEEINALLEHPEAPAADLRPIPPPAVQLDNEQQAPDALMQISAAAYAGLPSASTISLLLSFKGSTAIALADTGTTNTFMEKSFDVQNNFPLTTITPRKVTVAGGGELCSSEMAQNCKFVIQGKTFCTNFRILDLQGSDIILGVNWFKQYNPVTFDFIGRTLTMEVEGQQLILADHMLSDTNFLISAEECS
jgi:hypothetical protein